MATPIASPAPAAFDSTPGSDLSSQCDRIPAACQPAKLRAADSLSHAPAPRPTGSPHSSPKPAPAAYPPSGHDSVISTPGSPKQLYSHSSTSNTSRDARHSLAQSLPVADDDEKAALSPPAPAVVRTTQPRSSRDMVLDLEKQSYSPAPHSRRSARTVPQDLYAPADPDEVELEDKAFRILVCLSRKR